MSKHYQPFPIQLVYAVKTVSPCCELFEQAGLIHSTTENLALVQQEFCLGQSRLELQKRDEPKLGGVYVDFLQGTLAHRRKFGGGRGEAVVKAVGVKSGHLPSVLDATAGLGRDAFVLACIGCHVSMLERHPVVRLLLQDGLQRAYKDKEIGFYLQQHLSLLDPRSLAEWTLTTQPDVVYLDPMYPTKPKSALVKKEMRIFQQLIGADLDADLLLPQALRIAKKRVVVKRPDYAEFLSNRVPHFSQKTKNHRFDVYLTEQG